ncbi:type II toxin-antitoxin system RatA family toxin [Pokkaliibacter sp. CJK22405]|uniref:type II toxin-antitoxin system RatA family toxin n=1 Tax=Pokkaliibacter sp. CJK22405 TaxID=3384615 RepID=UPI003984E300
MATVERSALVMHSAQEMFDIVNDVKAYPEFLPWCSGTTVISEDSQEMTASIEVAKAGFHYRFTTKNTLQPPERITLSLVEGPFKTLVGEWYFKPLAEDACKVSLTLTFEFANKLAGMAMGKVFNQIATTMVDAFCQRAEKVCGKS